MNTLKELFLDELADRYDAEKRLVQAFPRMAKAAGLLQEILVEEKAANHLLSELARFKSNAEAAEECASPDSCADIRPLNGQREIRPFEMSRPCPLSMATDHNDPKQRPKNQ